MSSAISFSDLIRQVRAGDDQAAARLAADYELPIRTVIRAQLKDPRLRRLFDSMDVCQSVLASFFVGLALGKYDRLESPRDLLRLLARIARCKLRNQVKKHRRACRDYRRDDGAVDAQIADPAPGPSQLVTCQELLARFHSRLTDEERWLAEQRANGRPWEDIAGELGVRKDAARQRLRRAIRRVAGELGLEEELT